MQEQETLKTEIVTEFKSHLDLHNYWVRTLRNFKAEMFNREASNPKSRPDEILKTLALQLGQYVADIGAGGGYFSFRFAEAVGREGRIYAVDTNSDFLKFIRERAEEKGLKNIVPVLATDDTPSLTEPVDLIFLRNVSHHINNRPEYFKNLRALFKSNGRIAIVEHKSAHGFSFHGIFGHYVAKETLIEEMTQAGYRLVEDLDILPQQSFTIYSPPPSRT